MQFDTDYAFGSPVTRSSSNFPGDAGWTAATYTEGVDIQYTIQLADALSNGSTYWWRVRARDPSGSNTWSNYSVPRSISIDTTLVVDEFYQTTSEQFETGTLNATQTDSNSVEVAGW